MHKLFLVLFLTIISTLEAAIYHPIDTSTSLSCCFSLQHHNRVLVEHGKIKKVLFPEERLSVRMEETSGQIFVQSKTSFPSTTLISVVTEEGRVQDIELHFVDGPSEVVILQDYVEEVEYLTETPYCVETSSLDTTIKTLLQGEIPPGYVSKPFRKSIWKPRMRVTLKLVGKLEGVCEDLHLYEVSTRGWGRKKLTESDLTCCHTQWVYLEPNFAIVAVAHE